MRFPTRPAKGTSYRFVKLRYAHDPISGIGALKAPGRYHIAGAFRALYSSESPMAALSETAFLLRSDESVIFRPSSPRVLFALEYDLERVLDLRDSDSLARIGVNRSQLFGSWIRGRPESPRSTQLLGRDAFEAGVQAFLAPTAIAPHEATNIVVFPENLRAGGASWVQVSDPEGTYAYRVPPV